MSAVEKELLVEIDIMDQIEPGKDISSGSGNSTDLIDDMIRDDTKSWPPNLFNNFKLNPNTNQDVVFPILTSTLKRIFVVTGNIASMKTVAQVGNAYQVKPHQLPTNPEMTAAMTKVVGVYGRGIGITLYYVLDDKPSGDPNNPNPRVT